MEDASEDTASLTVITPPEDIDIDARNTSTDMTAPNATIALKRLFLTATPPESGSS